MIINVIVNITRSRQHFRYRYNNHNQCRYRFHFFLFVTKDERISDFGGLDRALLQPYKG